MTKVGAGAFSEVKTTEDTGIVVKTLNDNNKLPNIIKELVVQMFLRRYCKRIPCVVEYDLGSKKIFMEHVGTNMHISARKVDSSELIGLTYQFAKILCDIHSLGYVHGDVSTTNITRNSDGQLHLIDFGSSQSIRGSGSSRVTQTTIFCAPEILYARYVLDHTNRIRIEKNAEIWSFGIIVFHLFSRQAVCNDAEGKVTLANYEKLFGNWSTLDNHRASFPPATYANLNNYGLSEDCKDFLRMVCKWQPKERPTWDAIMSHKLLSQVPRENNLYPYRITTTNRNKLLTYMLLGKKLKVNELMVCKSIINSLTEESWELPDHWVAGNIRNMLDNNMKSFSFDDRKLINDAAELLSHIISLANCITNNKAIDVLLNLKGINALISKQVNIFNPVNLLDDPDIQTQNYMLIGYLFGTYGRMKDITTLGNQLRRSDEQLKSMVDQLILELIPDNKSTKSASSNILGLIYN